jgi:hypothetical protein
MEAMGEPVQQWADEPLGAKDLRPFIEVRIRVVVIVEN